MSERDGIRERRDQQHDKDRGQKHVGKGEGHGGTVAMPTGATEAIVADAFSWPVTIRPDPEGWEPVDG